MAGNRMIHVSPRAIGLSAAALILIAACSSGSGGPTGGGPTNGSHPAGGSKSASTQNAAKSALIAAVAEARKETSATETLTVRDTGVQSASTTGTVQFRRTRTLELSENLTLTAAGKSTHIRAILTGTAFYLQEAALSAHFGKPWIKLDLSALNKTPLASFAQLVHSLQGNDFANVAQLFAASKNVHSIGTQTVDGVSTTGYAGAFNASQALKALSPGVRHFLGPAMQLLGNRTVRFKIWIDGQHRIRRIAEVVTVNGETVSTDLNVVAINQPVQITTPPASQTYTPPGA
jgi:hypothetical protein